MNKHMRDNYPTGRFGYIPSTPWWSPYDELTPTPSAEEWELIDARCPPSPYGPTR